MSRFARTTTLLLLACLSGLTLAAQVSLTMEVQQEKKGKLVDKGSSTVTIISDGDRIAIKTLADDNETTIIYDTPNKTMTTVTAADGKLTAMRMPIVKMKQKQAETFEGTFEATGEKKQILGYTTEKYLVADDGVTSEMWVANVPGFDYGLIAQGAGQNAAAPPHIPGVESPVVLEGHTPSKNGKTVTHMYIRAVAAGRDVDLAAMEVPAGAEMTDMSAMLKGFGN